MYKYADTSHHTAVIAGVHLYMHEIQRGVFSQ